MAVTEFYKGGKIYQRTGAWREGKNMGYHVSDMYLPLYEKEFFLFFKGFIFHKQSSFPQITSTALRLTCCQWGHSSHETEAKYLCEVRPASLCII